MSISAKKVIPQNALRRYFSSLLSSRYGFTPPPPSNSSEPPPNQYTNPSKKTKKPPYKPESTLYPKSKSPVHSDLPFDFRFSYTESSSAVKPIGLREPKYSPFGPCRLDRTWTGFSAPAAVDPFQLKLVVDTELVADVEHTDEVALDKWRRKMEEIIGKELTQEERRDLIDKCQKNKCKRQINLGRDGLTHNMLNDIHNNWKLVEAVRIKCLGVPTVDMKNVCTQLEEKSGGVIIHRHGGLLILYRGRHYNPKKRPVIPVMLWKPQEPIYPKLVKTTVEGLSIEETKEMRKRGLAIPALVKLAKNGYYASLITMVRDAFLTDDLVRIDCEGLPRRDYKKIGVKLRDLVPCVLVTFQKEQIVVWKGKDSCTETFSKVTSISEMDAADNQTIAASDQCVDDESLVSNAVELP